MELWREIFSELRVPIVVCIGADVEKHLYTVLGQPPSTTALPVGWGSETARLSRYESRVVLRLPHLSRFRIFGRAASDEPLRLIQVELARHCGEIGVPL